jgi:hypothetical protein
MVTPALLVAFGPAVANGLDGQPAHDALWTNDTGVTFVDNVFVVLPGG